MTDLGALDVQHGVAAGTQRLSASATRRFYSDFNTVCLLCLSCCLLLVQGFLLLVSDEEIVLLLKYNRSRIPQARDKQVEDGQDQSMKGCSHKQLDKDNYQQ